MLDALPAYTRHCADLARQGLWRQLPVTAGPAVADFSSNDYLGLSRHPALVQAACAAAHTLGVGATGSRLLSGNAAAIEALEERIAQSKGSECALVFGTGFQANATALAALLNPKVLGAEPLVFSDRLNHASLHHACQVAGVRQIRFRHGDLGHLQILLERHVHTNRPAFIVSETVFGMDGDCTDVPALQALAQRFGAVLYLDEAHATGVLGAHGYGLACSANPPAQVVMGTFSKALGGSGGYIACSHALRDYLLNACTGFIYSTAPPPTVVAAMAAAWNLVPALAPARLELQRRAQDLRQRLQSLGLNTGTSTTHIAPIVLGEEHSTLQARERLHKAGIVVSAIRPPTVPPHTARLRVALCAQHTPEQINALVDALRTL